MELASDILDVNQLKNHYRRLTKKLQEETDALHTKSSNVKELRRQHFLLASESSESDKLLKRTIKSVEDVQKSSLVRINETTQRMIHHNNKSKNVLKDYSLFETAVSQAEVNNLQRYQNLSNILSEESIINMTKEIDQKLNDLVPDLEKEKIKFRSIHDEYVQLNEDQKILSKNLSGLTMSVKKLNFKYVIEKKNAGFK